MIRKTAVLALILCAPALAGAQDPLASWNEGPVKRQLEAFVGSVTDSASPEFVPAEDRIAVFDNDGTLWGEQPIYFQLQFAMDYLRQNAAEHPEWRNEQPYKAAIEGDLATLAASGMEGLMQVVMASHAGMTMAEFDASVRGWLASARHPQTRLRYTEMVYQPMLELLAYLRANGFQTWIVSGGGIDFLRTFANEVYGIPPQQVVGSSIELEFDMADGSPVIRRKPAIDFIDDKAGKPVGIQRHIGKRPLAAFGNSDGDLQMLQWTVAGPGPRLALLVHHTDAEREWSYDRESAVGHLDNALDEAQARGWLVADMQRDWRVVFPTVR